jgi:hypothetical protein
MNLRPIEKDWRADLAWYIALVVAVGVAFGLGQGPLAGAVAGAGMLAFTVLLALGRARFDALRVAGGAGDERNRSLYAGALAVSGGVLGLVVTGWFLVSVARGATDPVLMVLVVLFSVTFLASAAVAARNG